MTDPMVQLRPAPLVPDVLGEDDYCPARVGRVPRDGWANLDWQFERAIRALRRMNESLGLVDEHLAGTPPAQRNGKKEPMRVKKRTVVKVYPRRGPRGRVLCWVASVRSRTDPRTGLVPGEHAETRLRRNALASGRAMGRRSAPAKLIVQNLRGEWRDEATYGADPPDIEG